MNILIIKHGSLGDLVVSFGAMKTLRVNYPNSNIYLLGLALFTAFGTTISEITSSKGSDNLSIPFVSILFMIGYSEHLSNNGFYIPSGLGLKKTEMVYVCKILNKVLS